MTEQELARALLDSGRINQEHVQYAAQQRSPDKSFAQVLVDLDWVSREEILEIDPYAFDAVPGESQASQAPPVSAVPSQAWQTPPAVIPPAYSASPEQLGYGGSPAGPPIPPPSGQMSNVGLSPVGTGAGQPINGTMILVFGILGIVCCGILAPIAWVMGNNALKTIDAGQGDPSQRQTVVVGRILGIIGTVLIVLGILFYAVAIGMAIVGGGASRPPGAPPMPGRPPGF